MADRVCRWGILGTAFIAQKNWQAIRNAPNSTLVAVASRNLQRSRQFIDQCQSQVPFDPAPRACGSYEELLAADDIDAVYVPLPTGVRKDWLVRAAEAGKHVMSEKPCGVDAGEVAETLAACQRNNVQYMDGVMFMHSQRLRRIREVLDDGESVGQIKRISTQFTFRADEPWLQDNIRTASGLEPAGCLGDLGWYCIRFALWTMNYQRPQRVSGRLLSSIARAGSDQPTPTEFSGELFFADGVSAGFYVSFLVEHQQWAYVSGSKGYLHVPDFVLPYYGSRIHFDVASHLFNLAGCDFNMENRTRRVSVQEYSSSVENSQETRLFGNFSDNVLAGQTDPSWGNISLLTQTVMDACYASAGSGGALVDVAQ